MSEDLSNELEAINSIFGDGTVVRCDGIEGKVHVLTLPQHSVALRLSFPVAYPEQPPKILGTETAGDLPRKGRGKYVLDHAREILRTTFHPGSVCLFDLLQGLDETIHPQVQVADQQDGLESADISMHTDSVRHAKETTVFPNPANGSLDLTARLPTPIAWTLAQPITSKKSVFLARACSVAAPSEARAALEELTSNDKRVAKATHNINAYRIRSAIPTAKSGQSHITYQDSDDDGETAAGTRLLHLLQVMDVWNVFVVVSRWYGGVQLGPDRFRIISQTAREAVLEGGWLKGGGQDGRKTEQGRS
ncbi:MAG: hypothetical protein Q9191_001136 [Dirinaria sp. TL-2023a]